MRRSRRRPARKVRGGERKQKVRKLMGTGRKEKTYAKLLKRVSRVRPWPITTFVPLSVSLLDSSALGCMWGSPCKSHLFMSPPDLSSPFAVLPGCSSARPLHQDSAVGASDGGCDTLLRPPEFRPTTRPGYPILHLRGGRDIICRPYWKGPEVTDTNLENGDTAHRTSRPALWHKALVQLVSDILTGILLHAS